METPRIEITSSGLKCDNPSCDWENPTIQVNDYPEWLNASCPKCGENVLTEEDLNNSFVMRNIAEMINAVPAENFEEFMKDFSESLPKSSENKMFKKYDIPEGTERISMTLDTHKGIHITDIKPI